MPQQLIYTSAPVGLTPGRSGFCTVARSASMREALVLQLEQLSYYQRHSQSGGQEHPIFAYRAVDVRGSRFHVLSRIQDAGLDFTGRPNFIAHHLVFSPAEIRELPTPPVILRDWLGWRKSWTEDPQLLENEKWPQFVGTTSVPAKTWLAKTSDAINGYGLLETRSRYAFLVDALTDETILTLFAESMELLEVRDERKDFRTVAWQYTFTSSMQEQDEPADFRWRCLRSDNPGAAKFASPDRQQLSDVRATRQCTPEEAAFAGTGRQTPRFVLEPQDVQITEGETARFQARAEGIPNPTYQWFSVDKTNTRKLLTGAISQEFVPSNPALGVSRYTVQGKNSTDGIMSRTATLSVERKAALVQPKRDRPLHLRLEKSQEEEKKVWQEEKSPVNLSESPSRKGNWLRRLVVAVGVVLVAILVIGIPCFICMNPARQSAVANWLSAKLLRFRSLTNGNPSDQIASAKPAVPSLSQISNTNAPLRATNVAQEQTEKPKPNQRESLLADPGLSSDPNLPDGWKQMDIDTMNAHVKTLNEGQFELSAAAKGFTTKGDSLLFVGKTNAGSPFSAVLLQIDSGTPLKYCGIMVRQSEKQDSPFLFVGASSDHILVGLRPAATNKPAKLFLEPRTEIPKDMKGKPIFLKLDDQNHHFTPSYSFDGIRWWSDKFPGYEIFFKEQVWVGFVAYSGSLSNVVTARFSEKK